MANVISISGGTVYTCSNSGGEKCGYFCSNSGELGRLSRGHRNSGEHERGQSQPGDLFRWLRSRRLESVKLIVGGQCQEAGFCW